MGRRGRLIGIWMLRLRRRVCRTCFIIVVFIDELTMLLNHVQLSTREGL
jgi:hypothetical protein